MKSSRWHGGVILVSVLAIATMTGCPGTDVLNGASGTVSFEVVAVGDTGAFDCAVMGLVSLNVLPQDGVCAGGANDGDPCFLDLDCDSNDCAGAVANTFVGSEGFPIRTGLLGAAHDIDKLTSATLDQRDVALDLMFVAQCR